MNKETYPFRYAWAVLICLPALLFSCAQKGEKPWTESESPKSAPGQQALQAPDFIQQYVATRTDPFSGELPSERRWQVWHDLQSSGQLPAIQSRRSGDLGSLAYSWQPVDDRLASMAVTGIVSDPSNPQIFYFCTGEGWFNADAVRGAGIWKSVNAGQDWERLPSTLGSEFWYCQDIKVHPQTGHVYVATRTGGVQRSEDGGQSWQQVLGAGNGSIRNSICDLELTADGGIFAGIGIFDTDGLYYSPSGDPGTWVKQTNGFPSAGIWRVELATAPSNPLVAYAIPLSTDYMIDGVYRTQDGGNTWIEVENPGGDRRLAASQGWYDLIIAVDPNDENVVVAGGLDTWRSRDGGDSWQRISSGRPDSLLTRYMHVDQHGIFFVNSDTVYFTNDGGIYRCDNFTSDYPIIYERNLGYSSTQFYAADIAPEAGDLRVLGGTQDNGSLVSLHEGISRFKPVSGADGSYCRFDHQDGNRFYTSKQYQPIYRFKNGGFELPDTLRNTLISNNNLQFINAIEMDPNNPELIYQASSRGLMRLAGARSASSEDWAQASKIAGEITAIGISTEPPNIVFVGRRASNAEIFKLNDAHLSTSEDAVQPTDPNNSIPDAPILSTLTVTSIAVNPVDANHVLISYGNYGVNNLWQSFDALAEAPTWHSVEGDLPDLPVNWVMLHPGNPLVAYAATDLGVWYTDSLNGANTRWTISSNFPTVRTDMLRYRDSDWTVVAGTHGRGIFTALLDPDGLQNDLDWEERGPLNVGGRTRALMVDPNDPSGESVWAGSVSGGLWLTRGISAVGVNDIDAAALPQNSIRVWPNPFRQAVQLELSIEGSAGATLQIMDLQGRVHAQWAIPAAFQTRQLTWNPGAGVPPGLYLAVLEPSSGPRTVQKLLYQP